MRRIALFGLCVLAALFPAASATADNAPTGTFTPPAPLGLATCNFSADGSFGFISASATLVPIGGFGSAVLTASFLADGTVGLTVDGIVYAPGSSLGPDETVVIAIPTDAARWTIPFGNSASGSTVVTVSKATVYDKAGQVLWQLDAPANFPASMSCVKVPATLTANPAVDPSLLAALSQPAPTVFPPTGVPFTVPTAAPPADTTPAVIPPASAARTTVVPPFKAVLKAAINGPRIVKLGNAPTYTLLVLGQNLPSVTVQLELNSQLRFYHSTSERVGNRWIQPGSGGPIEFQLKAVKTGRSCITAVVSARGSKPKFPRMCINVVS